MGVCNTKKSKYSPHHCSVKRRQHYVKCLSMCSYRTQIRPNSPLSDSNSNAQELLVDVLLSKFNCYEACYNTNMATDICFGTLPHSIWKTIWSLHNMWQSTVKWLDNVFNIDFKRLFQYWNFCNKTNKFTFINLFNHTLLITNIFGTRNFFGFCYVGLNIPLMNGYEKNYIFSARCQWHFRYGHWKSSILNVTCYFGPEEFNVTEKMKVYCFSFRFVHYRRLRFPGIYFRLPFLWWQKKSFLLNYYWNLDFHSLMAMENYAIYGLHRRNTFPHFNKFQ